MTPSDISHHFEFLTHWLDLVWFEVNWTSKNMWCRYITWVCALDQSLSHTYCHALTLLSCMKALFIHEKAFNLTVLFRDHVTMQFVLTQLGRMKQVFNAYDENLCWNRICFEACYKKMELFPQNGWDLWNKSLSTLKHDKDLFQLIDFHRSGQAN